jgi:hypothetical protein
MASRVGSFGTVGDERFPGKRDLRRSMWTLVGVPVGIAFSILWATFVKTSPTVADDERIRGWDSVLRELPTTLFLLGVIALGLFLAVRAGRRGAEGGARRVVWVYGAALFFILLIVVGGSADNVMTTRSATLKWVLFPFELAVTASAVAISRRAIRTGSLNSSGI